MLSCFLAGASPAGAAGEKRTVQSELKRIHDAGAIDAFEYEEKLDAYEGAVELLDRLEGRRKTEMTAVVDTMKQIAADGNLTVSRLAPLWLILQRNREWWTTRELPASGARVSFSGSEIVWQYYPGAGWQIQPLATFGKMNGFWAAKKQDARLNLLFDELLAIAAERKGGLAWEYYFKWDGGKPPWVSGMAQGTAVQAFARAGVKLGRQDEAFPVASRALRVFETPPPSGVRVKSATGSGYHYLLYSSDKNLRVLNGFAQAVVGLYDYGQISGDPRGQAMFAAGDQALRLEAPLYDTGAWSLYAQDGEANLNYHTLNRDFLGNLCNRLAAEPYCTLRDQFTAYLKTPPVLTLISRRLRGGEERSLRFSLSKISRVSLTVSRAGTTVLSSSSQIAGGKRAFPWKVPKQPGTYDVRLSATDLAGNAASITGTVEVTKPKKKKRKKRED